MSAQRKKQLTRSFCRTIQQMLREAYPSVGVHPDDKGTWHVPGAMFEYQPKGSHRWCLWYAVPGQNVVFDDASVGYAPRYYWPKHGYRLSELIAWHKREIEQNGHLYDNVVTESTPPNFRWELQ